MRQVRKRIGNLQGDEGMPPYGRTWAILLPNDNDVMELHEVEGKGMSKEFVQSGCLAHQVVTFRAVGRRRGGGRVARCSFPEITVALE